MLRALILSFTFFMSFTSCSTISSFFESPPPESAREIASKKEAERYAMPEEKKAKEKAAQAEKKEKEEKVSESDQVQALKKRLLILTFSNKAMHGGKELSEFAAQEVKSEVSKNAEYVIVPEEEIDGYEGFLTETGNYNYQFIFEKARAHGISAIVTGTIEDLRIQEKGDEVGLFQTRYHTVDAVVRLNLYDAGTEHNLMSKSATAQVTEEHTRFFSSNRSPDSYDSNRGRGAVTKALDKLYSSFMNQAKRIAWVGRIAKIDLHRYYINAGEMSGITRGQLLKVFGDGYPIKDYQTGSMLGMAPGRFKGILKVVDYFGQDGAIAIIHSGASFKEKDRVEIYSPPH